MILYKLTTPLEELRSIEENTKYLEEKTENLRDVKDSKEDNYKKYCEECSKSKESRKVQIEFLKGQVGNEKNSRLEQIKEAEEEGLKQEESLKETH